MPEPEKAMAEINRVVRDRGVLIASNFIHRGGGFGSRIWSMLLRIGGISFKNQWTKEEYKKFLSDNGWRVVNSKEMCGEQVAGPKKYTFGFVAGQEM